MPAVLAGPFAEPVPQGHALARQPKVAGVPVDRPQLLFAGLVDAGDPAALTDQLRQLEGRGNANLRLDLPGCRGRPFCAHGCGSVRVSAARAAVARSSVSW